MIPLCISIPASARRLLRTGASGSSLETVAIPFPAIPVYTCGQPTKRPGEGTQRGSPAGEMHRGADVGRWKMRFQCVHKSSGGLLCTPAKPCCTASQYGQGLRWVFLRRWRRLAARSNRPKTTISNTDWLVWGQVASFTDAQLPLTLSLPFLPSVCKHFWSPNLLHKSHLLHFYYARAYTF